MRFYGIPSEDRVLEIMYIKPPYNKIVRRWQNGDDRAI